MSPSSTHSNPSPKSSLPPSVIQNGKDEIQDSQQTSPGVSPGPVRRPSYEKLDSAEVSQAMGIADSLSKMKPYGTKHKPKTEKSPPPKPAEFIPRPPPVPFSGNSNPDATALRATASLLQMQKAKAKQDLETLERLKQMMSQDPVGFTKDLVTGRVKQETTTGGTLGPTLGPIDSLLQSLNPGESIKAEEGVKTEIPDTQESEDFDITSASSSFGPVSTPPPNFPQIPGPQNIVRMPPINWSKYGIVGDSLDKLHDEQRTNPSSSEPERLATRDSQPLQPIQDQFRHSTEKAAPYVVAAPYDPLKDQPLSNSKTPDSRRAPKKPF